MQTGRNDGMVDGIGNADAKREEPVMARQNVYDYSDDTTTVAGWFNPEGAKRYAEETYWDGHNHISLATNDQWTHEALYRTAGGRWVLNRWSQWQGRGETWRFIDADEARDWLVLNEYGEDAIEAATGEKLEEERGPGGRPAIGAPINVRLGDELLQKVDAAATAAGVSRAEMLRALVVVGVETRRAHVSANAANG